MTFSAAEFERRMDGLEAISTGPCSGCERCGLADLEDANDDPERYELSGEPSFSWSPCGGCGSTLGGDRYPAHAVMPALPAEGRLDGGAPYADDELVRNGKIIHVDVCVDCLFHINYGEGS